MAENNDRRTPKAGEPDPQLHQAQTYLRALGYNAGAVNGQPSDLTDSAVESYMRDKGMTGAVDLAALNARMEDDIRANPLINETAQAMAADLQAMQSRPAEPAAAAPAADVTTHEAAHAAPDAPPNSAPAAPVTAVAEDTANLAASLAAGKLAEGAAAAAPAENQRPASVAEAQGLMRMLGIDSGPVDNIQGDLTNAAMTQYRQTHQLAADVGLNDLVTHMRDQVKNNPDVAQRMYDTLQKGTDNVDYNDARAMQYALQANGHDLAVDGDVGPITLHAAYDQIRQDSPATLQNDPAQQAADAASSAVADAQAAMAEVDRAEAGAPENLLPPGYDGAEPAAAQQAVFRSTPDAMTAGPAERAPAVTSPADIGPQNLTPAVAEAAAPAAPEGGGGRIYAAEAAPSAPAFDRDAVRNYERGGLREVHNHAASHGGFFGGGRTNGFNWGHAGHDHGGFGHRGGGDFNIGRNGGFSANLGGIRISFRPGR